MGRRHVRTAAAVAPLNLAPNTAAGPLPAKLQRKTPTSSLRLFGPEFTPPLLQESQGQLKSGGCVHTKADSAWARPAPFHRLLRPGVRFPSHAFNRNAARSLMSIWTRSGTMKTKMTGSRGVLPSVVPYVPTFHKQALEEPRLSNPAKNRAQNTWVLETAPSAGHGLT